MLTIAILLTSLFMAVTMGAIGTSLMQMKLNKAKVYSAQALHIAEAGVNYYRWVLYHDNEEYCNKEACIGTDPYGPYGPYPYEDSSGEGITGYYELYITPPALNGSTIVNIKSIGWVADKPSIKREIEVQCGIPSWSTYSTLANKFMRFGSGTEAWGQIHSNEGIRFDGLAHNIITSSVLDFNDPDHGGANEFAVHTHLAPSEDSIIPDRASPPGNLPDRTDVFMAGRSFPVSVVSFDLLDNYISGTYSKATTSGIVFDPRNAGTADPDSVALWWGCLSGGSCDEGFHVTLKNDNTFDISGVSSVRSSCGSRSNSINSEGASVNYPIPANGVIFIKNNVWVDGIIDNSRLTLLAFEEPFVGGNADIYITNDISYTDYDGSEIIGLIAQNDISVGQYSEDDLLIDAALIAKSGRVGREYYWPGCTNSSRNTITVHGSIATYNRYGFAYTDGTGYQIRNLNFDNNLTFSPPPHFPTTGEYTFISWKEK